MQTNLLPRSFKFTGILLTALAFLAPIVLGMLQPHSWEAGEPARKVANAVILLGLLFIILAKEKTEDEFISFCRMRAFRAALLTGLIYFLLDYTGVFSGAITGSSFGLMLAETLIYLAVFYISKSGIGK